MKVLISILCLATMWPVGTMQARDHGPNVEGVGMGHLYLNVRDTEVNKTFWIMLGGTPVDNLGNLEIIKFPDVLVILKRVEPSGGSVGSAVNHVGFRVPNLQSFLAKVRAAGSITEPGRTSQAGFV